MNGMKRNPCLQVVAILRKAFSPDPLLETVKADLLATGNDDSESGRYFPCSGRRDHFDGGDATRVKQDS
jgi:hypothetical protein